MDGLRNGNEYPWFTAGDVLVVLATLMFLVLGIIRHVRAEGLETRRTPSEKRSSVGP